MPRCSKTTSWPHVAHSRSPIRPSCRLQAPLCQSQLGQIKEVHHQRAHLQPSPEVCSSPQTLDSWLLFLPRCHVTLSDLLLHAADLPYTCTTLLEILPSPTTQDLLQLERRTTETPRVEVARRTVFRPSASGGSSYVASATLASPGRFTYERHLGRLFQGFRRRSALAGNLLHMSIQAQRPWHTSRAALATSIWAAVRPPASFNPKHLLTPST